MFRYLKKIWSVFNPAGVGRENRVLYRMLSGFLIVSILAFLGTLISNLILSSNYHGASPLYMFLFVLIVLGTLLFFRRGHAKYINYFFCLIILLITLNMAYRSGVENFYTLLMAVFYLMLVGFIFPGKKYLLAVIILFLSYGLLAVFQVSGSIHPYVSWRNIPLNYSDLAGILITLSIIVLVTWMFSNEINRHILDLQESEKLVKKERDLLETRVQERTARLREEQLKKLSYYSKLAEFGRLAHGIFHDLVNPLTALSLNLDQLKKEDQPVKIKKYLDETTIASENMKRLIDLTLDYSRNESNKSMISIAEELNNIQTICGYRARKAGIKLGFQRANDINIVGNRTKFSQMITNLVINAIEAHEQSKEKFDEDYEKEVNVSFGRKDSLVAINIQDNALGMNARTKANIFKPFFTTKEKQTHSGIGLLISKDIVESEFMGDITFKSQFGKGTEFIVTIKTLFDENNQTTIN